MKLFSRPLIVLALLLAGTFLFHRAVAQLETRCAQMAASETALRQEVQNLRADQQAVREAHLSPQEIAERLAPPDKPSFLSLLEQRASSLGLQAFKTVLEGERPQSENLAQMTMIFEGQAPDDLAVRALFETARQSFPGRIAPTSLVIERLPAAPLGALNLSFQLRAETLANASSGKVR